MVGKCYMGIDPGQNGGVAMVPMLSGEVSVFPLPPTEPEIVDLLRTLSEQTGTAYIEDVHSMPDQGVASSFKFGRNTGFLRGVVVALRIPLFGVRPERWQKDLRCLTGGKKHITRERAQQLYPGLVKKITDRTADALLIATWARNYERGFYGR